MLVSVSTFSVWQDLTQLSTEMDIWEANSVSTAVTPHSCQPEGYSVCTDDTCGGTYSLDRYAGSCDANGCDFNPYRVGARDFYGKGKSGVDTSKKVTVVTQFLGSGGQLSEIKRFYVQGGRVIANPEPTIPGMVCIMSPNLRRHMLTTI
jgi:cellulose 1,4-beta-cellobiosidase